MKYTFYCLFKANPVIYDMFSNKKLSNVLHVPNHKLYYHNYAQNNAQCMIHEVYALMSKYKHILYDIV